MDVQFFVAFSAILLVGRYLPMALPLNLRPLLADNAARPSERAAKCAISVAIGGLALLVSMQQGQGSDAGAGPAGVAIMTTMEARVLWFNSAALFLGTLLLGAAAVAVHPPPLAQQVAVDHLIVATEMVAINAFALNLCVFIKIFEV